MTPRRIRAHVIAATLGALASLHCGGEESTATTTGKAQPAAVTEQQVELVQVELTQLRPSLDLIVELVGSRVRLVTPNHTGPMLDFGRRAPDNEHLRVELLAAAQERFADAVAKSERREVRVRLDAKTAAADFVDLLYTMGQIGVLGYELEIATAEGPGVLPLYMPPTCYGQPSWRRCVNVHLRVTEQGTLVSSLLTDPSTGCDVAPEDSGELASISGRAITPAGGGCPGWPPFAPGDENLDQVLATLGKFGEIGPLCRTSEVSVEDSVTAAIFIPTIAALRAANQHVVFRAGGRATCAAGPISIDAIAEMTRGG